MESKGIKANQSLIKGLAILEHLIEIRRPGRVKDISRGLDIPESTVTRFLCALIEAGFVIKSRERGDYFPTLRISHLADILNSSFSIRDRVRPFLEQISRDTGESSSLAVREESKIIYLDSAEGPDRILRTLQRIGKTAPLSTTGVGKVIMADLSLEEVEEYIKGQGLVELTDKSITDRSAFLEELERVKMKGYAVDDEECERGVRCVAVPLKDYKGTIMAGISISAPAARLTDAKIIEYASYLASTVMKISQTLTGRDAPVE